MTEGNGAGARTTGYFYGADGRLERVADALNREVSFTRDADGRVLSTQLPDGRLVSATYDANGNLTSLTPPGRPAHSFSYDSRDLTTQYAPPVATPGGPTGYAWNADMQPTVTTRPDGDVITSEYDLAGRLSTLTIPRGSFGFAYDGSTGKLTGVTGPGGSSWSYTYQGSLLSSLSSGGPVSGMAAWTYDNNYCTTARKLNGANAITFGYDTDDLFMAIGSLTLGRNAQNGLLAGTTLGSVTDAITYSTYGEVSGYGASASASQLLSESYLRDNLGRITQQTEVLQGTTTTWAYEYDTAGRLLSVRRNGAPFESYTYDQNDNRLTKTTTAGTTTYGTDDQDRLLSAVGPDGAQSWMYDANGDLLQRNDGSGQTSFDYDTTGQLLSVTKPNGNVISYELDAGNKQVVKRVNGVAHRKWLYAGGLRPVAEYDANDNLVAVFNGGYMVKNGATYRLLRDHLGSVRLVVEANTGTVAQKLSYGPFGEVLEDTNPGFQPFGYAGGLYDPETRLVRFGARDYDAGLGRFLSRDALGSLNRYAYCNNDPVNWVDVNGLQPLPDGYHVIKGSGGENVYYNDDSLTALPDNIPYSWTRGKEPGGVTWYSNQIEHPRVPPPDLSLPEWHPPDFDIGRYKPCPGETPTWEPKIPRWEFPLHRRPIDPYKANPGLKKYTGQTFNRAHPYLTGAWNGTGLFLFGSGVVVSLAGQPEIGGPLAWRGAAMLAADAGVNWWTRPAKPSR